MAKWDDDDDVRFEKMSKHQKIFKKSTSQKSVKDLRDPFEISEIEFAAKLKQKGAFAARVVEVHKRYVFVSAEPSERHINTRDVWLGTMARRVLQGKREERNILVVGDRVLCFPSEMKGVKPEGAQTDLPHCVVDYMRQRTCIFGRIDPSIEERVHVLAANLDQLFIVASYLTPKVRWGLVDRYLVTAESQNIPAYIILNKEDQWLESANDAFKQECAHRRKMYEGMGYTFFSIQANAEHFAQSSSCRAIAELLKEKITLLSGHSGVGKSTLINTFEPEIVQPVETEVQFYKGRHTTSYASFIKLGTGGYVIDTPGIRSFSVGTYSAIDLTHAFRDMRPFLGACKFRECTHQSEPGCAIKEAVSIGHVDPMRYKSFCAILNEDKTDFESDFDAEKSDH